MNITACAEVFSLFYVRGARSGGLYSYCTHVLLQSLAKTLQFFFPILKRGGMLSIYQQKALWSLCIKQINTNSLYYYLSEIGLI